MDQVPITFTHVSIENIKQEIMNGNENCSESTENARDVEESDDEESIYEDHSLEHIKEEIDIEVAKLEEIEEGRRLTIINIQKYIIEKICHNYDLWIFASFLSRTKHKT